ncbi:ribosome recycling factor [Candidatus Carsonella ruddii]|uniref:Putative ribosome recycling factor n=1 Tax=Candidatus Carsonella ruddii PC isolate NHV TaxID=1202540 RepID=J3Z1W0_CARRU|nr:ribosome recycling factor [Candidatus Carsonella ruddii]AFP84249.1 putative ribosome recycling factor [Candidatus Carsonella ruddii PC isolate NHV]
MNDYREKINNYLNLFKEKTIFLNIKNLNTTIFNNFKIKYNNLYYNLSKICFIKSISKKKFLLTFNDQKILSYIVKSKYFENYGFNILKIKNEIELNVPNISSEFRNNFLKIIKQEYFYFIEIIENLRKKELLNIKTKSISKNEIIRLEKIIKNDFIKYKIIFKNELDIMLNKIFNE